MKKLIEAALAILIVYFLFYVYRENKISKLDHFAIGKITEVYESSKRKTAYYSFEAGDYGEIYKDSWQLYKGSWWLSDKTKKNYENKSFLIGYSKKNPNTNYLFLDYPIESKAVADSFNVCCSPKDLFEK